MAPGAIVPETSSAENGQWQQSRSILRASGSSIVDGDGRRIILKGLGLGGHLNLENFITGLTGHEHEHREALANKDAEFLASLGLNSIRIPTNYRHLEDDMNPSVIKPEGFRLLDRVINACAKHALFWKFKHFQDRVVDPWVESAKHYRDNPTEAGYNPLNEAADPEHTDLIAFYTPIEKAIRSQNAKVRSSFERKVKWMRAANVPIHSGEFGPVYASAEKNGMSAHEQLSVYRESEVDVHWSIWTYKDINYQGTVYTDPDSMNDDKVKHIYHPFFSAIKAWVPEHLQNKKQFERVVRETLLSEYLGLEMAENFAGKSEEELDTLAASFKLENCRVRDSLNALVREDAVVLEKKV
ncbi:glycoside hydrolase [Setomelanomma holmii]|uniref:Glycoside hydrolase n=1 Tax=Setomelanomma holmii TaxID=210430 RepID=A0A9P4HE67_9PLEO|nr:glycoside hydrolase [Setomelanomma holmii]